MRVRDMYNIPPGTLDREAITCYAYDSVTDLPEVGPIQQNGT